MTVSKMLCTRGRYNETETVVFREIEESIRNARSYMSLSHYSNEERRASKTLLLIVVDVVG